MLIKVKDIKRAFESYDLVEEQELACSWSLN